MTTWHIEPLAVTAITNFVLAAQALFLAGLLVEAPKARMSAAWHWGGAMFLLGLAALLGGIDHGFIEPAGLPRFWIQRLTWLALGGTTFFIVRTIAAQFLSKTQAKAISRLAWAQLLVYTAAVFAIDSFLVAVVNYALVLVWLLFMNLAHLRDGRGSWQMVAGTCTLFLASAVQAMGIDMFSPVDHDGLYHLISMPGLVLLYFGGRRLERRETPTG